MGVRLPDRRPARVPVGRPHCRPQQHHRDDLALVSLPGRDTGGTQPGACHGLRQLQRGSHICDRQGHHLAHCAQAHLPAAVPVLVGPAPRAPRQGDRLGQGVQGRQSRPAQAEGHLPEDPERTGRPPLRGLPEQDQVHGGARQEEHALRGPRQHPAGHGGPPEGRAPDEGVAPGRILLRGARPARRLRGQVGRAVESRGLRGEAGAQDDLGARGRRGPGPPRDAVRERPQRRPRPGPKGGAHGGALLGHQRPEAALAGVRPADGEHVHRHLADRVHHSEAEGRA
mmetsp:Transcript_33454/g.94023  ORF Transcript_33454/g.94023 Transcript_33454/m.94023 type:complete len:284 (-) Transcript_33454:497-1348(-)